MAPRLALPPRTRHFLKFAARYKLHILGHVISLESVPTGVEDLEKFDDTEVAFSLVGCPQLPPRFGLHVLDSRYHPILQSRQGT
jgi:hypothetical protein